MTDSSDRRKIENLRAFVETNLARSIRESMQIEYSPHEARSAVLLGVFGRRFRLEQDETSAWNLMTDDAEPKLLERFDGHPAEFQKWLLLAIRGPHPLSR